jgi:hypothetical protein
MTGKRKIVIDYRADRELRGSEILDGSRELLADGEVTDADIELARKLAAGFETRSKPLERSPRRGPRSPGT